MGGIILLFLCAILWFLVRKIRKKRRTTCTADHPTQYICLDGHTVKSRGELIIDNHLFRLNIKHKYEDGITVNGQYMKYDWYLPEYDIYIEYWGYYGKQYKARKREKLKLYKKGHLELISIEDHMLHDIYHNLTHKLKRHGIKIDKRPRISARYCPHCGAILDERFKLLS